MQQQRISKIPWGIVDDKEVCCFKIINQNGEFIEVTNYGATLVSVCVRDKEGKIEHVILGFPALQGYINDQSYLGSTIGRFANRIGKATFNLDGKKIELEQNDGPNSNHSGSSGFHKKVFDYQTRGDILIFSLFSADGEGGFPGNLKVEVHYHWNDENELKIDYYGQTDQNTLFNLTNHSYFDLSSGRGQIFDHRLSVFSDQIVQAGPDYMPTGELVAADETYAFTDTRIEDKLFQADGSIKGLNICYVLDSERQKSGLPAAILFEPASGRELSLYTSYPGLMLYTGDYLNTIDPGFNGNPYKPLDGMCLEAQFFPDSPNHPAFPSAELRAGELAHHYIIFKFDTHK
ncbi:MAG TPA: aldose epimerase family protein [Pedobacter sp.]|uniref:aldose epimerase family protein n=1 Tax=Pedobacter sp. TaxID=1411316 RepID=UPI002BC30B18|nr:aldose epimerase family protein [Pedobacter sp.]HMI03527.1 aldose epimerase family protein [Pedobacter sp.]